MIPALGVSRETTTRFRSWHHPVTLQLYCALAGLKICQLILETTFSRLDAKDSHS